MFNVLVYNNIKAKDMLDKDKFVCGLEAEQPSPEAILVRSEKLHEKVFADSVLAIGRAGMGVDNIPVGKCTEKGIVVFNTPGANANAVKELVLMSMIMTSRKILPAIKFISSLPQDKDKAEIKKLIEKEKKQFAGEELAGKMLLVFGLGNIGARVASAAAALGMKVVGYDPFKKGLYLPGVKVSCQPATLKSFLAEADFISLHVELNDSTRGLFGPALLGQLQNQPVLLNFSRGEIVNEEAVCQALLSNKIANYVTDFHSPALARLSNAIILPHLGASTAEAEKVCAEMVCAQIADFLEDGTIINSVNFPDCDLPRRNSGARLIVINQNVPNVLAKMNDIIGQASINIEDQLNRSQGALAYNIIELNQPVAPTIMAQIQQVSGIIRVRQI